MTTKIQVRVLRALVLGGQVLPAGPVAAMTPADAVDAIDSGRAVLSHEADGAALVAERKRRLQSAMRRLPRDPGSPWEPWR